MFYCEIALGQQPASHQEDAEQKLLSAPLLLVAIETQAMMESRRVLGEAALRREGGGTDGSDHRVPMLKKTEIMSPLPYSR